MFCLGTGGRPNGSGGVEPARVADARGNRNGGGRLRAARRAAAPALAAPSIADLANVRLVCVAKRIAINWLTELGQHARRRSDSSDTADLIRAIRSAGAGALRPARAAARTPRRRSTTTTRSRSRPARSALVRARAAIFALDLEETAARHRHRRRLDDGRPRRRRSRSRASSPATVSTSPRSRCSPAARRARTALPRALEHRGRRQPALPVPLQLGGCR